MTFNNYFSSKLQLVEDRLNQLVPEKEVAYNQLFKAARYSLMSNAKRIRPILTLAVVEAMGGDLDIALTPACCLEMIHTYSLIHDDLPCMDNDDFRRGKPSLHKAFSEGHAVLAGDFLLTYPFEILSGDNQLTAEQKIRLISILAKSSGGDGMIGGQIMDVETDHTLVDIAHLEQMHLRKTGALISASIEFGAIIANVSELHLHSLRHFGEKIGLAFQIIDDILDVTSSEKKHGKSIGSDQEKNKVTYVTILGLEQSQAIAQSLLNQAKNHLKIVPLQNSTLHLIADIIVQRNF